MQQIHIAQTTCCRSSNIFDHALPSINSCTIISPAYTINQETIRDEVNQPQFDLCWFSHSQGSTIQSSSLSHSKSAQISLKFAKLHHDYDYMGQIQLETKPRSMLSQRNGHTALQIHTWNDLFSGASTAKIRTKNSEVRKTEHRNIRKEAPRNGAKLHSSKKARTLLHKEAELLDGVLGIGPHCSGKRRSRAQIRRARGGTGGTKRGRFSRRSEGGHLKVYLFPGGVLPCAAARAFASTAFLPFSSLCVRLFARTSVHKESASRRTSTIHTAPLFHTRPKIETVFLFLLYIYIYDT